MTAAFPIIPPDADNRNGCGYHAFTVDLDGYVGEYDSEFVAPQDEPTIEVIIPDGIGPGDAVLMLTRVIETIYRQLVVRLESMGRVR
jgi:hypothetical protein